MVEQQLRLKMPGNYDGSQELWEDWDTKITGYCGYQDLHPLTLMEAVRERDEKVAPSGNSEQVAALQGKSAGLYYLLLSLCTGSALQIVKSAGKGNGLEAWRLLTLDKRPRDTGEYTDLLMDLLEGREMKQGNFEEMIMTWEEKLRRYESVSGDAVTPQQKLGTLKKYLCPPEMKITLRYTLQG